MDIETTSHIKQIWDGVLEHWAFYSSVIVILFFSVRWAMHKQFTTHNVMNKCKTDLSDSLRTHQKHEEARMNIFSQANADAHQELREGIDWIKHYLIEKNGK